MLTRVEKSVEKKDSKKKKKLKKKKKIQSDGHSFYLHTMDFILHEIAPLNLCVSMVMVFLLQSFKII